MTPCSPTLAITLRGLPVCIDHTSGAYEWAHNLVTLHYSDDLTDYPLLFKLWQPAELEKIEAGLVAAGIKVKASKQELKTTAPAKWRQYLLNLWRRHAHKPEVAAPLRQQTADGQEPSWSSGRRCGAS